MLMSKSKSFERHMFRMLVESRVNVANRQNNEKIIKMNFLFIQRICNLIMLGHRMFFYFDSNCKASNLTIIIMVFRSGTTNRIILSNIIGICSNEFHVVDYLITRLLKSEFVQLI